MVGPRTLAAVALGFAASGAGLFAFFRLRNEQWNEIRRAPSRRPSSEALPKPEAPSVEATLTALFLDGVKVCDLPTLDEQARTGAGAICKGLPDPTRLEIGTLRGELARRWPDGGAREATAEVRFHEQTPFRLMMEVVHTASQSDVGHFRISTPSSDAGPALSAELEVAMTKWSEVASGPDWLTVLLVADGISMKLTKSPIGPGCQLGEKGMAVPSKGDYDYREFARCIASVLAENSGVSTHHAYLSANPNVPARTVLRAISVLRCGSDTCLFGDTAPKSELFSNVLFKVPHPDREPWLVLPTTPSLGVDPATSSAPPPKPEAPSIEATPTSLLVDGAKVCELPALEEQIRNGAGPNCKTDPNPNHLDVGMLKAELDKRWPDAGAREATADFRLHEETPYRLVVELIFTVAQSQANKRLRISTPPSDAGPALSADFELPSGSLGQPPWDGPRPADSLTLFIVNDGITLKLTSNQVGAGCQLGGTGVTVPRNGDHDYRELATCIATLLAGNPGLSTEYASLTANPNVPIRTVLRAVGVLRCGSDTCLSGGAAPSQTIFSNVHFKVPR